MEVKKSDILFTIICKTMSSISYYLLALSFIYFIENDISNSTIFKLLISIIIIYILKLIFKSFYDKFASKTFYSIKHNEELRYFNKINTIKTEDLKTFDLNLFGNLILEKSYYKTKLYYDLGNTILPTIIGLLIITTGSFKINFIYGILTILGIIFIYKYRLNITQDKNYKNENSMLKDFINKILIIKKLNIFYFFSDKLNNYNDDKINLKNEHKTDNKFNTYITILLIFLLTGVFIFIKNSITKLGLIMFFVLMIVKLQNVIYDSAYFIKIIKNNNNLEYELSKYYQNFINRKPSKKWKKIRIKNGIVKYTNTKISIPDFELIKGDHISIMGAPKEGKSTILNILSGVYNLDSGEIFFDGKSTKNIVDALYLSKNTELFNLSLRDNLSLGTHVTDEKIFELLEKLNLLNWYNNLENGLDTIMDMKLSNSTLQKLNIIKAIILDKDVYFFDEPTYDLDIETEKIISDIIKNEFKNKTVIIVTHKPLLTTICKKHYFMKNHTLLETEPLL